MALTVAFASSAAAAPRPVYVDNQYKPSQIPAKPSGEFHHALVHGITWTQWNEPVATGEGTYTFQVCTPSGGPGGGPCADAVFFDALVLVKLSDITVCKGRPYYTELEVTPNDAVTKILVSPFHVNVGVCRGRRSPRRHRGT
jgi:hypothetical protein